MGISDYEYRERKRRNAEIRVNYIFIAVVVLGIAFDVTLVLYGIPWLVKKIAEW